MCRFNLCLILFLFSVISASAASTVECHCFQERQFNPQKSRAADPYFLATTQNSLLASLFKVEKKSLVRAKMSGRDSNDLWISHYLAEMSGKSLLEIDRVRSSGESWGRVVAQLEIGADQLKPQFVALLGKPEELAALIVDNSLIEQLRVPKSSLVNLRSQGSENKELILTVFLAQGNGADPLNIYSHVNDGESWGKLLHDQGLFDGAGIEQKWKELLKR